MQLLITYTYILLLYRMEISHDMELSQLETEGFNLTQQWQMLMTSTEDMNSSIFSNTPPLPCVSSSSFGQNMEPVQLFNMNPCPVIDFGGTLTKQTIPRSYHVNSMNSSIGSYCCLDDVGRNVQPKLESYFALNSEKGVSVPGSRNLSRRVSQAKDHILAERRRREKLSQRLFLLSNLVPGLKKTDKASILGGTIKYLQHLQEKVKFLEEQASQKTMESVVFVSKSRFTPSSAAGIDESVATVVEEEPLPEIEARFSGRHVMIRIHCEKKKGVVEATMAEIEKLQLTVINSSVVTFGPNFLHLIVTSQMSAKFNMTPKDVAKSIKTNFEYYTRSNLF